MATGSPGAPALTTAGKVGSHDPSSALAGPARPISRPIAASMGQTNLKWRNPLPVINQWRIDPFNASALLIFDVADHIGRHTAGPNRRDPHLQPDVWSLEHLAVAEVDRHVLAAAGAVEDHVAAAHL